MNILYVLIFIFALSINIILIIFIPAFTEIEVKLSLFDYTGASVGLEHLNERMRPTSIAIFPSAEMRDDRADRLYRSSIAIRHSAFARRFFPAFIYNQTHAVARWRIRGSRPEGDFTRRFPVFVRDMTISPLLGQWRKHGEKRPV